MADHLFRVADVPFHLARPDDTLGCRTELADGVTEAAVAVQALYDPSARADGAALLRATRTVRHELAVDHGRPLTADPDESRQNRDNDLAFGIVRTDGAPLPLLVDAALAAYGGVLDIAVRYGAGIGAEDWRDLAGGFDALLGWLAVPDGEPVRRPAPAIGSATEIPPDDALRRWVRGHHVFMVLAQGGALAAACLRDCAAMGDEARAIAAACVAVAAMAASRSALRFAGDVTKLQYQSDIRPTLMPPLAPPKMSGLHWRDHEALVTSIGAAHDGFAWLAGSRPDLLAAFKIALDGAYLAHQRVCEHFVGRDAPSLLATARSSRSAVSVLHQLHVLRRDLLPPSAEADDA